MEWDWLDDIERRVQARLSLRAEPSAAAVPRVQVEPPEWSAPPTPVEPSVKPESLADVELPAELESSAEPRPPPAVELPVKSEPRAEVELLAELESWAESMPQAAVEPPVRLGPSAEPPTEGKAWERFEPSAEREAPAQVEPLPGREPSPSTAPAKWKVRGKQRVEHPKTARLPRARRRGASEFTAHIDETVAAADLSDLPAYILAATPHYPPKRDGRIDCENPKVVKLMEVPPQLRDFGFDLDAGGEAQVIQGRLQRSLSTRDKTLALWEDGTLVFVATGGEEFLCWGKHPPGTGLRINETALIESVYLFAELSRRVHAELRPPAPEVNYRLELRHMSQEKMPVCVVRGGSTSILDELDADIHAAPAAEGQFDVSHRLGAMPGAVGFSLVAGLYSWFGLDEAQIPYSERPVVGKGFISAGLIKW